MSSFTMPFPHQANELQRHVTREDPMFIVLNAGSGRDDVHVRITTIHNVLSEAGQNHHIFPVEHPQQLPEMIQRAVKLAQQQHGAVVAAGGDGTINAVAQEVLASGRPFGVLPQGKFNYFSRAHGIPSDMREATRALLHSTVRPVQVGFVNQRVFLVNASLGLYAQVFEDREFYEKQWGRSRMVAIGATLLSLLRGQRPFTLHLDADERVQVMRTLTLVIGNNHVQLDRLGIPDVGALQQGRLIAIIVRPIGVLAIFRLVLHGALRQLGEAENLESFAFQRLTISARFPYRRRRIKVALDGEVTWLKPPLVFEIAPTLLWLLTPTDTTA